MYFHSLKSTYSFRLRTTDSKNTANMRFTTLLHLTASVFPPLALAAYTEVDNFNSSNLFTSFDFFNEPDPNQGAVKFLSLPQAAQAQIAGFIPNQSNAVYLGVDNSARPAGGVRGSVRLNSKKFYRHGLFVADVAHMPGGTCSSWPSFWMVGRQWPRDGELDIIEGVNTQSNGNIMTLHTGPNCAMKNTTGAKSDAFSGVMATSDCDINAPGQLHNAGCSIQDSRPESFGAAFNKNGGGVFAVEWTSQAIQVWSFARNAVPADLAAGSTTSPDPTKWGVPAAAFQGSDQCNIDNTFQEMQIVIGATLCGDWAGTTVEWAKAPECAKAAPTCEDFVRNNAGAFDEAYWAINSIRTYNTTAPAT